MTRCPFPYANEPACDQTIAQTGGSTYTAFNAGWLVAAILLFVVHTIQFIRLCRIRGWTRKQWTTSYLHQIYAISLFNSFDLVIRACDPMNWDNRIAFPIYRLLMDMGTWSAYSLVMLCVCSWVRIMRQISGRPVRPVMVGERVTLVVSFCFFFSIAIAFSYSSRPYLVLAIDYVLNVTYSCILVTIAWVHGLGVYCHLSRFERSSGPRDCHGSANVTSPQTTSPPITSRTSNKREASAQRKKTKIIIILKLMVVMTICIGIAAILQLYNAYLSLHDRYNRFTNPEPYPKWRFATLLQLSGFTIIHGAVSTACLVFFHKFAADSPREMSSHTSDPQQASQGTKSTAKPGTTAVGVGVGVSSPISPKPQTQRDLTKPSRSMYGEGGQLEIAIDTHLINPAQARAGASVERRSTDSETPRTQASPSFTIVTMTTPTRPVPPPRPHPSVIAEARSISLFRRVPSASSSSSSFTGHPLQTSPLPFHTTNLLNGIAVEMTEDGNHTWQHKANNQI